MRNSNQNEIQVSTLCHLKQHLLQITLTQELSNLRTVGYDFSFEWPQSVFLFIFVVQIMYLIFLACAVTQSRRNKKKLFENYSVDKVKKL